VLSRTDLAYSSRRSTPNHGPFIRLQPLCRPQKSQLLCNQANPASFSKMPGVWGRHPESNYGTPGVAYPSGTSVLRSQCPLCCASSSICPSPILCANSALSASRRYPFARFSLACGHAARFARHSSLATRHFLLSTFRINTCKSVSKQTTLTSFRINTYEKRGEGGVAGLRHEV
jgi:hypothetical protein